MATIAPPNTLRSRVTVLVERLGYDKEAIKAALVEEMTHDDLVALALRVLDHEVGGALRALTHAAEHRAGVHASRPVADLSGHPVMTRPDRLRSLLDVTYVVKPGTPAVPLRHMTIDQHEVRAEWCSSRSLALRQDADFHRACVRKIRSENALTLDEVDRAGKL